MSQTRLADHLTLILAALAPGRSTIAAAPSPTADAVIALGARIDVAGSGFAVAGTGNGCLLSPARPLDFGDDATPAMLITGLVATYDMTTHIGCEAPCPQPLLTALGAQGAQITSRDGEGWTVAGPPSAHPVAHEGAGMSEATVAAIMLAALNAPGRTCISGLGEASMALIDIFDRFAAGVMRAKGEDTLAVVIDGQAPLSPCQEDAP